MNSVLDHEPVSLSETLTSLNSTSLQRSSSLHRIFSTKQTLLDSQDSEREGSRMDNFWLHLIEGDSLKGINSSLSMIFLFDMR